MSSPLSVSHEIADRLRREILRGQYRVGERLPSERDLTARFSVSRGVVREAFSQLEQQGIIETQPGGVRVRPLEQASLAILGPLLALEEVPDPRLVDQFLEIFSILTGLSARDALLRATDEEIATLRHQLAALAEHAEDFEAMQPHWQAMLEYLGSVAGNLVVRFIGNDIKAQVVEQMMQLDIKPVLPVGAGRELVAALDIAFRKRDGRLAASAFEKHFDVVRAALQVSLANMRLGIQQAVGTRAL